MNEKVENLILEHLRAMRADMSTIAGKVDALQGEMISMRQHFAGFLGHQVVQDQRVAEMDDRLERIEKRLELRSE